MTRWPRMLKRATAAELAERKRLRDVLATALAKDKVAEMRATPTPTAKEN